MQSGRGSHEWIGTFESTKKVESEDLVWSWRNYSGNSQLELNELKKGFDLKIFLLFSDLAWSWNYSGSLQLELNELKKGFDFEIFILFSECIKETNQSLWWMRSRVGLGRPKGRRHGILVGWISVKIFWKKPAGFKIIGPSGLEMVIDSDSEWIFGLVPPLLDPPFWSLWICCK